MISRKRIAGMCTSLATVVVAVGCDPSVPTATRPVASANVQWNDVARTSSATEGPAVWRERPSRSSSQTGTTLHSVAAPTAANAVVNGTFAAGLSAWTVVDQAGGAPGTWYLDNGGGSSPLSGWPVTTVFDQPRAMSDQTGPSSHILYQDVTIPSGGGKLSFHLELFNRNTLYFTKPSLSLFVAENQQFRVDIIRTTDPVDVVHGVLQKVFATLPGYPAYFASKINVDVSGLAGQTVRLRFAQVQTNYFFQVGIDNVSIR